jgi:hypothetical protein
MASAMTAAMAATAIRQGATSEGGADSHLLRMGCGLPSPPVVIRQASFVLG